MSASHYWPEEPGEYTVDGYGVTAVVHWDGRQFQFSNGDTADVPEMKKLFWLGVRREQKPIDERDSEIEKLREEVERIKSTDLDALLREAIADFRANVKQPTQAANWAFEWVNRFIEAVES